MSEITERLSTALADRYQIERHLGEGGMVTVYLAEDLKHERKVALKVLKPELAAVLGAERFVQEIKTTASLQHPNILPLFDSGEADGFLYYVMPFIDGETLRDKLNRETQLGIEEAVSITTAVADALHSAHQERVIHRDIKPENILLHKGRPMVADFGIALAVSAAAGGRMTETGLSLGTPHYMSPEQATAEKNITHRSDIYSLGSVLYEMLTGEPPHTGASAQAIIMKIVTDTPRPVTELRKSVPPNVTAAVAKALEKLAADRFESAAKFAEALTNPAFKLHRTQAARRMAALSAGPWNRVSVGATGVAAVLGVLALWGWLRPPNPSTPVRELAVALPALSRVSVPVLSPVGERIVFIGDGQLWIRSLRDRTARPLPGTAGAFSPFWSPDGRWIGYFVGRRVFKVPIDGGTPVSVTSVDLACADSFACGGSWTDDGRMLLSTGYSKVFEVGEDGGEARTFLEPADREHFHRVVALPGGKGALVDVDPDSGEARIDVWDGTEMRTLALGTLDWGSTPAHARQGYVLFNRDGLWAVPFSFAPPSATGEPFIVTQSGSFPSVSDGGVLLYTVESQRTAQAVWVDRTGTVRDTVGSIRGSAFEPAIAPDGQRVAMRAGGTIFQSNGEIWIIDPARGLRVPLGTDDRGGAPTWSADGTHLFYEATKPDLVDFESRVIRVARPGGDPQDVVLNAFGASASTDGRYLVFSVGDIGALDIQYLDLRERSVEARVFAASPALEANPRLSPDGRYVAYLYGDYEDGNFEVFLSAFPDGGERHQLSDGGLDWTTQIRWSPRGDRLYYTRSLDGAMMEVDVNLATEVTMSSPRVLFTESDVALDRGFDVSPDGSRFLVVRLKVPYGGDRGGIVLVENWLDAFEGRNRRN